MRFGKIRQQIRPLRKYVEIKIEEMFKGFKTERGKSEGNQIC